MPVSLRLSRFGVSAQTLVPGVYAWAVTVGAPAFGRGAPLVARAPALAALAILVAGAAAEHRWGPRVRAAFTWGFVLASAVAWGAAPSLLAAMRADPVRGGAGVLGWGLFAFASSAPVPRPASSPADPPAPDDLRLTARRPLARGDAVAVGAACILAAALQLVGWRAAGVERELLVRFVALAAGIAVVGAAAEAIVARHAVRTVATRRALLQRALRPVLVLGALLVAGVLLSRAG